MGSEAGLTLSFDRSTVAHWLSGTRPRGTTPQLITEALSRRLGRPVTPDEAGLTRTSLRAGTSFSPPGAESDEDIAKTLRQLAVRLGDKNSRPRDYIAYTIAALEVPGLEVFSPPRPVTRRSPDRTPRRNQPVDRFEVDAAEAVARVFHRSDVAFGGGHGRRALAGYLAADLGPKLRRPASPELRRRLLSIAGQLTCLCAFMHFDDNLHAPAQRYYLTALRLAADNNDPLEYAIVLRGMSVQADALGHREKALDLAKNATAALWNDPGHGAFLHGQLAVAEARNHSRREAFQALAKTEQLLGRAADPVDTVVGRYHEASLLRQEAVVREELGDREGALRALGNSLRLRPPEERRSRAVVLAEIGRLQIQSGQPLEAVRSWHQLLDEYPALTTRRIDGAVADIRGQLRPYRNNAHARSLLQRITSLTVT